MTSLFGYGQQKKLAEIASENVQIYRQDRLKKLESAKIFLIGPSSPIRTTIIEGSKKGKLTVDINFQDLNKENKCGCNDHIFSDEELDKLIIGVADFLEKEGFNYGVMGQSITINWPDPDTIKNNTDQEDTRQDLKITESIDQKI